MSGNLIRDDHQIYGKMTTGIGYDCNYQQFLVSLQHNTSNTTGNPHICCEHCISRLNRDGAHEKIIYTTSRERKWRTDATVAERLR